MDYVYIIYKGGAAFIGVGIYSSLEKAIEALERGEVIPGEGFFVNKIPLDTFYQFGFDSREDIVWP